MTSSRLLPPAVTSAHASCSHASSSVRPKNGRPAGSSSGGSGAARTRVRRCGQRRVLAKHPLLQHAQLDTGIRADLVRQQRPDPTQRGQRVGLPTAPVQSRHQVDPELLMQRMRSAQRLRLGDHVGVAADRQPCRQPHLQAGQTRLRQPLRLRRERAAVGELAVRLPTPQRERLDQMPLGLLRRTVVQRLAGPTDQVSRTRTRRRRPPVNHQPVAPADSTDHDRRQADPQRVRPAAGSHTPAPSSPRCAAEHPPTTPRPAPPPRRPHRACSTRIASSRRSFGPPGDHTRSPLLTCSGPSTRSCMPRFSTAANARGSRTTAFIGDEAQEIMNRPGRAEPRKRRPFPTTTGGLQRPPPAAAPRPDSRPARPRAARSSAAA